MSVFIIIPTYNEKENLPVLVKEIFRYLPESKILVVDDNSPDGTGEIAEGLKTKYLNQVFCLHRQANRGYGPSCLDGFLWVLERGAKKIIQMDADLSHPPEVLPHLVNKSESFDMVLGSRYVPGGGTPDWPLRRRFLSRGANFYARTILGLSTRDMTTGFRCFNRRVLEAVDLKSVHCVGYGFLAEMVYRVHLQGFSIGEQPIIYRDRTLGKSKMGLHIAWEGAVNILKLKMGRFRHSLPPKAIKVES